MTTATLINLEQLLSLSNLYVYWLDHNNIYQGCSRTQALAYGLRSPHDIVGKRSIDLAWGETSPKTANAWEKTNLEIMAQGASIFIEETIVATNGDQIVLLVNKIPLTDAANKTVGLLVIATDITPQKIIETKLKYAKEQLELTLDHIIANMPAHVYWKDLDGVYLGSNDQQARSLGLKDGQEIVGKTDFDLPWNKKDAALFCENDLDVIRTGKTKTTEETAIFGGKEAIVLSQKVPLRNNQGIVIGILGISVDITKQKKLEKSLEQSKQKAEEASELKSQFIMNMQHDLRTPASGVAAMLELLANKEQDSEKKETLEEIADSSRKLLNILNAILEFDSIDKGTIPVLSEKFNLHDIIKDVEALEAPTATLKQIDIKTHFDARLPKEVIGDPFRIQRILINLLSNAIKFTAKGHVEIDEVLWEHVDDKNVLVQIIVKDTGVGIPKEKQKVIFERFTRLDPSNKGIHEGLGLGLSMVKQFVEEMNGTIEVKSTLGQGTTFICTFPFKLPESDTISEDQAILAPTKDTAQEEITLISTRILLVEDDRIAQLVGKSLLADEFHVQLDIATTGQEAIDLVKKSKTPYDLIFMDIGLPDGSGCKFTKQIHSISDKAAKIPIIALTAHDNDDNRQSCRVCGMQDYLTKPLGVLKMDRIFRKWLHQTVDHGEKEENKNIEEDKIIDLKLGAKLINGDENKAKETLKFLIDMLPDYEKQLKENFRNNDFEELKNIAHKLKGATAYCGAPRLKQVAKILEEKIRLTDKPEKEKIKPLYKSLLSEINNLTKAF